jgi:hypothetical protein
MGRPVCASPTSSLTQSRHSRLLNPGRRLLPATGHVTAPEAAATVTAGAERRAVVGALPYLDHGTARID